MTLFILAYVGLGIVTGIVGFYFDDDSYTLRHLLLSIMFNAIAWPMVFAIGLFIAIQETLDFLVRVTKNSNVLDTRLKGGCDE